MVFALHVNLENFVAVVHFGELDLYFPVESVGSLKSGIDVLHQVSGADNNDLVVFFKPIHLVE
jgi:hypothetical protein